MASQSTDRVLLLGPLQVIHNGVSLNPPPSRKVRALLGYLAMSAGRVFGGVFLSYYFERMHCCSKVRLHRNPPYNNPRAARFRSRWIRFNSG
jgi:hypothetical protein